MIMCSEIKLLPLPPDQVAHNLKEAKETTRTSHEFKISQLYNAKTMKSIRNPYSKHYQQVDGASFPSIKVEGSHATGGSMVEFSNTPDMVLAIAMMQRLR